MDCSASERFPDNNVCVVGLGYVGLTLATAMADAGFKVHGVEIQADLLKSLASFEPHFFDAGLSETFRRTVENGLLTYDDGFADPAETSVYIITVGTPLDGEGRVRLQAVEAVAARVANVAEHGSLVILRSTVKIGAARSVVKPILDAAGKCLKLAVCPERTLQGRALMEVRELPQIIGADDPEVRRRCVRLFERVTRKTVVVENFETAETIKLVDNAYRDVMFGFANEIAELCGEAGISALEVIEAGKLDYLRTNVALPGPVGGPCLEKDSYILAESAQGHGVGMSITRSARQVNEALPARVARNVLRWSQAGGNLSDAPVISLLGFAFKGAPATDDLRGAMSKPIHAALSALFPRAVFRGYDPVVPAANLHSAFGVEPIAELSAAFDGSDVVVIMNNHPALRSIDLAAVCRTMKRPGLLYDLWNMHAHADGLPTGVALMTLGAEARALKSVDVRAAAEPAAALT